MPVDENFCADKADGNHPDPDNPSKYVTCIDQKVAYEYENPLGWLYEHRLDAFITPNGDIIRLSDRTSGDDMPT